MPERFCSLEFRSRLEMGGGEGRENTEWEKRMETTEGRTRGTICIYLSHVKIKVKERGKRIPPNVLLLRHKIHKYDNNT